RELGLKGETIGVDGQTMRVFEYHAFEQAGIGKISNVGKQLLDIRAIKTSTEVEAMRKAIQMSERALERLVAWVEPGMTEMAIGTELSRLMVLEGSVGEAFSPLIQTGPNSALPHGFMTERKLQEGEFLLIDFGGKFEGYPADITRTFCLGTPTAEMQKIYDAVLAANRAAIAIAAPGVSCGDVDKAARDEIVAAGYGEYFIHRTGHGLGLEGHELPQIAGGVSDTLQPGMVFTVEPGIYVPGLGGVRIEDDVAVTETGVDVLTRYPRQLMR
ncbi:MAG: M24 family metallopeptidase, partial [Aggregatilineales bacterium]